jgi:hypothetical protein
LPTPGGDQQDVGLLLHEPQGREVLDEPPVQAGLGGEVELLQRLVRGELGEPHAAVQASLLGRGDLGLEEVVEELGVARLLALSGLQGGREGVGDCGHLQVGQVASELLVDRVGAHQQATSARAA